MRKDTAPHAIRRCYACGTPRPERDLRPFGWHAGQVVTWTCRGECTTAATTSSPRSPRRAAWEVRA